MRLWDVATGQPHGAPAHRPHRRGERGGVQPRRARCWPPPAPTGRCGCGTWPPADPTAQPARPATPTRCTGWRSARTGALLATASGDRTVRLWDVATGQPHGAPLTGHTDAVLGVAFSPDGRLLATASADQTVRLWDVADRPYSIGRPAHRPHRHGDRRGVQPGRAHCWPPPATTRRCGCGTWPPANPTAHPLTGHTDAVYGGGVQPRRAHCWPPPAPTRRCGCGTWPPANPTGAPAHRPHRRGQRGGVQPGRARSGHRQRRPDGAAVGRGHRPTRTAPRSPATPARCTAVAFSPDGRLLATASDDQTVRLWDVATGQTPRRPADRPHRRGVRRWRSARTGALWPPPAPTRRCGCGTWPPANPTAHPLTGHTDAVYGGGVQPGRAHCWPPPAHDRTVRLWDVATGRPHGAPLDRPHRRGAAGWRSARTGACWPPPAPIRRCGCGTRTSSPG